MTKDEFNKQYHKIIQALNECDNILAAKETAEQAYQRGLDEAWEAAKRLAWQSSVNDLVNMGFLRDKSVTNYPSYVLGHFTACQALAKIRKYEERKKAEDEAIKVGDELVHRKCAEIKVVVTRISDDGNFSGVSNDGGPNNAGEVFDDRSPADWRKTGRHFPQIAEVLAQIANDE